MEMKEKLFRLNGLLEKWDKGTITDEEIIEIARYFMYIPEKAETKALAKKFKKVIDYARYKFQDGPGRHLPLVAREDFSGSITIGAIDPDKGYIVCAHSAFNTIYSHSDEIKFKIYQDGSFEVNTVFYVQDKVYNRMMDFSETIEYFNKEGFLISVEETMTLDHEKGISVSEAKNLGYGRYKFRRVAICDTPDRVLKTVVYYNDKRTYPRVEKSLAWETIASMQHDELGNVSPSQLPSVDEEAYYRINSDKYTHTHEGYSDDIILTTGFLPETYLKEELAKVKEPEHKKILSKKLSKKFSSIPEEQ